MIKIIFFISNLLKHLIFVIQFQYLENNIEWIDFRF